MNIHVSGKEIIFKSALFGLLLISSIHQLPLYGQNWELVSSGIGPYHFYDIEVVNEEIWVVGSHGTLMHSNDGGNSFSNIDLNSSQNLYDIYFLDSLKGWISGGGNSLYSTTDGGITWHNLEVLGMDLNEDLVSIYFNIDRSGWVLSKNSLYKSLDGTSWSKIDVAVGDNMLVLDDKILLANGIDLWSYNISSGEIRSIIEGPNTYGSFGNGSLFAFGSNVWYAQTYEEFQEPPGWQNTTLLGVYSTIFHTSDGGSTWSEIGTVEGTDNLIRGMYFRDELNGLGITRSGGVLRTIDGGKTWTDEADLIGEEERLYKIHKQFVTGAGLLFHKMDSTTNEWIKLLEYDVGKFFNNEMVILDSMNAWVNGFKTTDGGDTWSLLDFDLPEGYIEEGEVEALTKNRILLIVDNNLYISEDAGNTWTRQTQFNSEVWDPHNIFFLDSLNGWIVSLDKLAATLDGGSTWEYLDRPGKYDFIHSMHFLDEKIGFLVIYQTIYKTEDGGITWNNNFSLFGPINDIYFSDNKTGWAVTGPDWTIGTPLLLYTNNAGEKWTMFMSDSFSKVYAHENEIWLMSLEGGYYSDDGGSTWLPISGVLGEFKENFGLGLKVQWDFYNGKLFGGIYRWCSDCEYSDKGFHSINPPSDQIIPGPEPLNIKDYSQNISIYPNPSNLILFIENNANFSDLTIIDQMGRKILNIYLPKGKSFIDTSILPEGLYNLLFANRETSLHYKILITH